MTKPKPKPVVHSEPFMKWYAEFEQFALKFLNNPYAPFCTACHHPAKIGTEPHYMIRFNREGYEFKSDNYCVFCHGECPCH